MLFPKKVKFRKWQTMRSNPSKVRIATRGIKVSFGEYGLRATTSGNIRSNHIESARRVISRTLGKNGKMWIRIFPDRAVTQKANEVGMGKGKGDPIGFEVRVLPGRVMFEVAGVSKTLATEALTKAGKKLPLKVKVSERI